MYERYLSRVCLAIEALLVTRGRDGMSLVTAGDANHVPALARLRGSAPYLHSVQSVGFHSQGILTTLPGEGPARGVVRHGITTLGADDPDVPLEAVQRVAKQAVAETQQAVAASRLAARDSHPHHVA